MVKVIVHRGTRTIGGSCIEISSGTDRIILDLGLPLMAKDGGQLDDDALKNPTIENGILPQVDGLYQDQTPTVNAVLLSHPHLDHYGLMDWIHPDIPIWMGGESKTLIKIGNVFYPSHCSHPKLAEQSSCFNHWKPFNVGPFTITSYLMDHSAFGASSLLIEVQGKRIFYTGDFRGHGRKGKLFEALVSKPIPGIDCLLMEGTTLGGGHNVGYPTEEAVKEGLYKVFSTQKDMSFITAAGSNVDRLVSIYKAAKRANRTMVIDLYQVYLLEQLKKFSPGLPPHFKDFVRVFYLNSHAETVVKKLGHQVLYKYKPRKIEKEEILDRRNEMILRIPLPIMGILAKKLREKQSLQNASFIYSMWSGYLERDPAFQKFCETNQTPLTKIHTSGHAYIEDLKRLSESLSPKALLPIHTLSGDDFDKHFANVVRVKDGESFEL